MNKGTPDFVLTVGQELLTKRMAAFLWGRENCLIVRGYAGTGKTHMIGVLVSFLEKAGRPYRMMAPTGRAAKVLRRRSGREAYTIHKTIYSNDHLKEYRNGSDSAGDTFKVIFGLTENRDCGSMVYIVDEASMVGDHFQESEYVRFGSGRLLSDLLGYVGTDRPGCSRKIIVVGDPAQLPPVGSPHSAALDEEYLRCSFGLRTESNELTEPVRQDAGSGILLNATRIRNALRENDYGMLDIEGFPPDVQEVERDEAVDTFLSAYHPDNPDSAVVLAYSNRAVTDYNRAIRARLVPDMTGPVEGDAIVVVANHYAGERHILNGDFGAVGSASIVVEERIHRLRTASKTVEVRLTFRDMVLRFADEEDRPFDLSCKIVDSLLDSEERDLTSLEMQALYVDFKMRHRGLRPGTPEFRAAIRADPWFNALRIKYGYAVTCHKAQGGEWNSVILDFDSPMTQLDESYFRWAYTAMTRARSTLFVIGAPHIRRNVPLHASGGPADLSERTDLIRVKTRDGDVVDWIQQAIEERMTESGLKITGVRREQYCLRLMVSQGTANGWARIMYNGRNRITRMEWGPPPLGGELRILLGDLQGKELLPDSPAPDVSEDDPSFAQLPPSMSKFLRVVRPSFASSGIRMAQIRALTTYHLRILFQRSGERAAADFFFDGRGRYTRCVPDGRISTCGKLVGEVLKYATGGSRS